MDEFMKSDMFEDFGRESNQTAKILVNGFDNTTNNIDTLLGTIQNFVIEK